MGYGKLNVWFRKLDCCPKNVWKVELVIKTCGGDYLVDFDRDVINKLRHAYPDYQIDRGTRDNETVIKIIYPHPTSPVINHIELEVPPGCYMVRAWVCYGNLWTDRAMAMVCCDHVACVNLIVPPKRYCIRDVLIPVLIAAHEMKLDDVRVRLAAEVLMLTGQIQKEAIRKEVMSLINELKEGEPEFVKSLEYAESVIKQVPEYDRLATD